MFRPVRWRMASFRARTGSRPFSRRPATRISSRSSRKASNSAATLTRYILMAMTRQISSLVRVPPKRHEVFYFTETTLSAARIDDYKYRFTDQPGGWLGATVKPGMPILTNLRIDPFERTGFYNGKDNGSWGYYNWFVYEFWRFVLVQQEIAKAAQSFIEFPPMQKGASFNLEALKAELAKKMEEAKSHTGQ